MEMVDGQHGLQRMIRTSPVTNGLGTDGIWREAMNQRVLGILEYDKICDILRTHLASDIGREFADKL